MSETFCDTYWNSLIINYRYLQSWAYWQCWLLYSVPATTLFRDQSVVSRDSQLEKLEPCHLVQITKMNVLSEHVLLRKSSHLIKIHSNFCACLETFASWDKTLVLCKMRLILWKHDKVFHHPISLYKSAQKDLKYLCTGCTSYSTTCKQKRNLLWIKMIIVILVTV